MIEAITFDFWDTIAIDDSDEPKRAALGLPGKPEARLQMFVEKIVKRYPHINSARAAEAYQAANERFRHEWHTAHRTPSVTARIYYAYEHLGLQSKPGEYARLVREIDDLVRDIEMMEIRIPPNFAPGVHNTLQLLAQEYKLGIISDTIHTHGRGLRNLLERQGLLQYFSQFIFSDEVGIAKPSSQVFLHAAIGLDVSPARMVHVGDRESNDVSGPLDLGMQAILFTGVVDRGSQKTRAQAICRNFADLPAIIKRLR
ncbi:MAG: HAD family hydrolase [Chloroflexi bacterium]|nr:HAD family hydrolase [Chloroflexota bacterium]